MPPSPLPPVRGLLLAAGAGRRFGEPKALVRPEARGPTLVESAIGVLRAGGCDGVSVVVGAAADEVTQLITTPQPTRVASSSTGSDHIGPGQACPDRTRPCVDIIVCRDWAEGMGASLRAGLAALAARSATEAALVTLVDLPDVGPDVVARLLSRTAAARQWRTALSRAAYVGIPGHPALIGRDHWHAVSRLATGDRGAREYYRTQTHELIECGDLASGLDADRPEDLTASD